MASNVLSNSHTSPRVLCSRHRPTFSVYRMPVQAQQHAAHHHFLPTQYLRALHITSQVSASYIQSAPLYKARAAAAAAAAAADSASNSQDDPPVNPMAALPHPHTYHQPNLTGKERAALRSQSEAMVQTKRLQRVQIGVNGVTLNVLHSIMDILMKHEFVRIKLGEGCGFDRKQAPEQFAKILDAAVVHRIGFTVTLYRQKGLPRPDSLCRP